MHLWFLSKYSASFFLRYSCIRPLLHEQNSQVSSRVELWLTQEDNWCSQKNVWHTFNTLGPPNWLFTSKEKWSCCQHGSLKIRGRKSQINTVTMEPQCWRKSNPVVCSGRQMVFTHSNTPTHTDTHTGSLRWDVTSGPTKKFTTVEFYSEDSSLVINVLWLLCVWVWWCVTGNCGSV